MTVESFLSLNIAPTERGLRVTGKLVAGLSSLKKLKDVLPQSKPWDVYCALFESNLGYANAVWGSLSSAEIKML